MRIKGILRATHVRPILPVLPGMVGWMRTMWKSGGLGMVDEVDECSDDKTRSSICRAVGEVLLAVGDARYI